MNKGKKVNVQQYITRREEIKVRLNEIVDLAESENKRAFTDTENDEIECLKREMNALDVRIACADKSGYVEVTARELAFDAFMREHINSRSSHPLKREFTGMISTGAQPMIPLTINDIIPALEEGLIISKLGLPLRTGLAGDYCWPTVSAVEAEVAGEAVALTDKKIEIGKIVPNPQRVGVTIKITSQTINQTEGVAYDVVKQQIPMAVTRTLNKLMFTTGKQTHKLVGPFSEIAFPGGSSGTPKTIAELKTMAEKKKARFIKFANSTPTFKELVLMRALPLMKGIEGSYMAYVMDEYTKAVLETTDRGYEGPTNLGNTGRYIIENNAIAGVPVFCTNYINTDDKTYIGFGSWGYEPIGQFGEQRFIINPYSEDTSDVVRLTLNGDWAFTTLRPEAFTLGELPAEEL